MDSATFYRLVKSSYVKSAFDGSGARLYGGRWNSAGKTCVYLGSSKALCVLEALVHLTLADLAGNYSMLSLQVPASLVTQLDMRDLPEDWQEDPAPASTKAIGDGWLESSENGLVLQVPSTITGEWNALFNPAHPQAAAALKTVSKEPFFFDPRFSKDQ